MRSLDWVALVLVTGCLTLIALGKDQVILGILTLIAGFYFGQRLESRLTSGDG